MINVQLKLTIYSVLIFTDIYSAVPVYLWWFPDKFPRLIESDPPAGARDCSFLPLSVLDPPGAPVWRSFHVRKEWADRLRLRSSAHTDWASLSCSIYWVKWLQLALVTIKRDFLSPVQAGGGGGGGGV